MPPHNPFDHLIIGIDRFQRRHALLGFPLALIKKYSEDEGGYRAALLTYYGFLSLFPLLLVLSSVLKLLLRNNPEASEHIISGVTAYVPVIGNELERNVHGLGKTGVALVLGLLVTLYGARGVADVLRNGLDQMWEVPHKDRIGFPHGLLRSLGTVIVAGVGLVLTPIITGYLLALGRGWFFHAVASLLTAFLLFWIIVIVAQISSSRRHPLHKVWLGSLLAAIVLELLQLLGVSIVTRELNRLDSLYGTFAIVLGLLYWIYLQAQVLMYGFEIDSLRVLHLWPRSLRDPLTEADRHAYQLYAARAQYRDDGEETPVPPLQRPE